MEARTNQRTYNQVTAQSLYMFTGRHEMQLLDRNDPETSDLLCGRTCVNCNSQLFGDFLVIPTRHEITIMCGPCVRHLAGNPQVVTDPAEITMAVSSLEAILEDA